MRSTVIAWASLVRVPNTFTVLADTTAGYLLASGDERSVSRLAIVLVSAVSLYWGGMVLNDLLDVERDRLERPRRPLPSGRVTLAAARRAVIGLLVIGVVLGGLSGQVAAVAPTTWLPALVAMAIALSVWLYDGPLKRTMLAPLAMGACRMGSLLLGASTMYGMGERSTIFPPMIWGAAAGMGLFIAGVTTVGRREAHAEGDHGWGPKLGVLITVAGLILIASVSRIGGLTNLLWKMDPKLGYPLLVAVLALPLLLNGMRVLKAPVPSELQAFVRRGILLIIPLAAAISALAAGPWLGIAVFSLTLPARGLATWFRVT